MDIEEERREVESCSGVMIMVRPGMMDVMGSLWRRLFLCENELFIFVGVCSMRQQYEVVIGGRVVAVARSWSRGGRGLW